MSDSLWPHGLQLSPSLSQNLLKSMSIELVMPSHPLSPLFPPALNLSESVLPKNIQGWWIFRIDWFDLLATQVILKSLLQHHILKASILWHSAFFMGQVSHPHMTTGKTIALTLQTIVNKVMSLLFNMLSRFVIAFLLRSKRLLISWLQSLSKVILEPPKIKSVTASTFPLSIWLSLQLS